MLKSGMLVRLAAATTALAVMAAVAFTGAPALAARGGAGAKKGGGGTTSTAVLTYTPAPVPVGNTFTVTGAGFAPNSWVGVGFFGAITWDYTLSDASGNISYAYPRPMNYCDSYLFEALQGSTTAYVYIDVVGCP